MPTGAQEPLAGWRAPGGEASCLLGLPGLGLGVRARFGQPAGIAGEASGLGGGLPLP